MKPALSGFATRESSIHGDFASLSYFEKMEMLKKKIVETHRKVDSRIAVDEFLSKGRSQRT